MHNDMAFFILGAGFSAEKVADALFLLFFPTAELYFQQEDFFGLSERNNL